MKRIFFILLLLTSFVSASENYFDSTSTTMVTNAWGDMYYQSYNGTYGYSSLTYLGYSPDPIEPEYEYYIDRLFLTFDLSVPDTNCKVKKTELQLTTGVNWDATKLTSFYTSSSTPSTVHDAIGNATDYVTNQSDGAMRDLGSSAVTQLEDNWMDDDKFTLGLMEYQENDFGTMTYYALKTTYYYPPNEADTWVVDDANFLLGKSTGLGVGDVNAVQDVNISSTGMLKLNGDTRLGLLDGRSFSIEQGGSFVMEQGTELRIFN